MGLSDTLIKCQKKHRVRCFRVYSISAQNKKSQKIYQNNAAAYCEYTKIYSAIAQKSLDKLAAICYTDSVMVERKQNIGTPFLFVLNTKSFLLTLQRLYGSIIENQKYETNPRFLCGDGVLLVHRSERAH